MPRVSHYFVTDRPLEAVFDIVTTARFWTEWHPATRSVEGDVDHPAQLGDQITEYVRIAGIEGSGTWTVVEHDRPHRLALETDLGRGAVPYCGGLPSRRCGAVIAAVVFVVLVGCGGRPGTGPVRRRRRRLRGAGHRASG